MGVGPPGSKDKEQGGSKLLTPEGEWLFLSGLTSPGESQGPLQAVGRESIQQRQAQRVEQKGSTIGIKRTRSRYEAGDVTGTGTCLRMTKMRSVVGGGQPSKSSVGHRLFCFQK